MLQQLQDKFGLKKGSTLAFKNELDFFIFRHMSVGIKQLLDVFKISKNMDHVPTIGILKLK
jgi:hypothetical protein